MKNRIHTFIFYFFVSILFISPVKSFGELNKKALESIKPYLLPKDHPLKPALDQIFQCRRVTMNDATLAEAGFVTHSFQPRSFIRVVSHPNLPKHLLKIYPDSELNLKKEVPDWKWFVRRCKAARMIQETIMLKKIKNFIVPLKFIYLLPENPSPPIDPAYVPKIAILLVQDMNLVSKEENLHFWKEKITEDHLNELYTILKQAPGMSAREDNIVLTKRGKLAFIDTEYYHKRPEFRAITPYLSSEMQAYWEHLIKEKRR